MMDKILNDTSNYNDVQSLKQLHGEFKKDPEAVKNQVAQQFEAMLLQLVLRSMREANKVYSSGLFGSDAMDTYSDMYDNQLSLLLSKTGTGFANDLKKNMDTLDPSKGMPAAMQPTATQLVPFTIQINHPAQKEKDAPKQQPPIVPIKQAAAEIIPFNTQEEFVKKLWPAAKVAANMIGANPGVLLAQAALETNWGKKIISDLKSGSSHNLFNIKASSDWRDKTIAMETLEQKDGVLMKEKANFRHYNSYIDSFMDYVSFLKQNTRYAGALNQVDNPKQFTSALQEAGYATDSHYADKIWQIFSSKSFKGLIDNMK